MEKRANPMEIVCLVAALFLAALVLGNSIPVPGEDPVVRRIMNIAGLVAIGVLFAMADKYRAGRKTAHPLFKTACRATSIGIKQDLNMTELAKLGFCLGVLITPGGNHFEGVAKQLLKDEAKVREVIHELDPGLA